MGETKELKKRFNEVSGLTPIHGLRSWSSLGIGWKRRWLVSIIVCLAMFIRDTHILVTIYLSEPTTTESTLTPKRNYVRYRQARALHGTFRDPLTEALSNDGESSFIFAKHAGNPTSPGDSNPSAIVTDAYEWQFKGSSIVCNSAFVDGTTFEVPESNYGDFYVICAGYCENSASGESLALETTEMRDFWEFRCVCKPNCGVTVQSLEAVNVYVRSDKTTAATTATTMTTASASTTAALATATTAKPFTRPAAFTSSQRSEARVRSSTPKPPNRTLCILGICVPPPL